jgi:pimeloyl-ACP methyl ester carboxylesterase
MASILASPSSLVQETWTWRNYGIRYAVQGHGKPVILVHGFGGLIGHWQKNIGALAAGGYQVYALDLLGFGHSDKPPIDYTLHLWQDLLKDFWQEKIQAPTVFVGNSIGALLCLMMVTDHPELCAGGILLNCAGGLNHQAEGMNPLFQAIMKGFSQVVSSETFGPLIFNQIRRKSQIRRTLYQVYGNRDAVTDELVDMLHGPSCDPGAQKVFGSILAAPAGPSPAALLPKVNRPLQVLWGEADPWAPVSIGRKMFNCPESHGHNGGRNGEHNGGHNGSQDNQGKVGSQNLAIEFTAIAKTGHCPHDERPEVVNPLILTWLDRYHR